MSSVVAVSGSQGFIISSDSIVFKFLTDANGQVVGKIKGITRKLFQIQDDIITVGLGNWNTYFPIFNTVASMNVSKNVMLDEIRTRGMKITDTRICIFSRHDGNVTLDIVENGQVRLAQTGAIMYPEQALNSMFLAMYESPDAMKIRMTGMLGMATLVHAYNLFASSLCSDISAPFDTILFLQNGVFSFSGGTTRLPIGEFV